MQSKNALTDSAKNALIDLDLAFRQLEFSIKLLSFCELGKIDPLHFNTNHIVDCGDDRLFFPRGKFSDSRSLQRAAGTSILIAMGASALVLDDAFKAFGIGNNPEAVDNDGQIRMLVYMVRCAYAHGIAAPRWEVQGRYARSIAVNLVDKQLVIDLRQRDRQSFDITELGGYPNWYRIRDAALRLLK